MDSKPDPQKSTLCLEITRGHTAHAIRPIQSDRFLIGGGEWCHLRLGGDTPALHSVLVQHDGAISIEAIVAEPPLMINGICVESADLCDGDEVSIGAITLKLHGEQHTAIESVMQPIDIDAILALDQPASDVAQISAEELVDQLGSDMSLVDAWGQTRNQAADSLIDAARSDHSNVDDHQRPLRMLRELETAVHSLNRIADDLTNDNDQMSQQEIAEAADSLVDYQQQIVGRLDDVLQRIEDLKDVDQRRVA